MRHTLTSEKDYIDRPKASGYRGIHLVYKYLSDRSETHNGLLVEIQLRSRIQHAWATAVEIVGTFLDQSLKASEGSAEWLRFFELTGSVFAHVEGTAAVEGHPSRDELVATVREMRNRLRVNEVLHSYGTALTHAGQTVFPNAHYFILNLKPVTGQLEISEFSRHQLTTATNFYLALEKTIDPASAQQVVLVSADSFASLRRLYPNYFLDTTLFSRTLTEALA